MNKTKKSGLGKGLDSLIPSGSIGQPKVETVEKVVEKIVEKVVEKPVEVTVRLADIEPNKEQPRKNFNEDALMELSDSIKQFGVIQPLLLQKKDGYYEIIAGERRWRAAKLAGVKEVPAIIKDYSEEEIVEIALIENIQREDLNPIEEALAYRRLIKEYNLKQDVVAEKVSKSRTSITNSMRLLKLADEVQQMVIDEMISSGHARTLLGLEDKELQVKVANMIFDENLSVRETEKLVKQMLNPVQKKEKEEYKDEFIYENLTDKMKSVFGSKVSISRKQKDKGKIEIEYYSTEDLERIVDLISSIK